MHFTVSHTDSWWLLFIDFGDTAFSYTFNEYTPRVAHGVPCDTFRTWNRENMLSTQTHAAHHATLFHVLQREIADRPDKLQPHHLALRRPSPDRN